MRRGPAALLRHRGHGPDHLDLILGSGPRCATLRLARGPHGWQARWLEPHRRRYLGLWRAPLAGGRGAVARRWRGTARWMRRDGGWKIVLPGVTTLLVGRGRATMVPPP